MCASVRCYGSLSGSWVRYGLKKSLRRLCTRAGWGLPAAGTNAGFRARFRAFVGLKAAERVWAVWRPSMALDSQMSLLRLWMVRPRSCISWCSVTARRLEGDRGERARPLLVRYSLSTQPHNAISIATTNVWQRVFISSKCRARFKMHVNEQLTICDGWTCDSKTTGIYLSAATTASSLLVSDFPPDVGSWLQTYAAFYPQERQWGPTLMWGDKASPSSSQRCRKFFHIKLGKPFLYGFVHEDIVMLNNLNCKVL